MSTFITPRCLRPGSTVAALTLGWGGPAVFPKVYRRGRSVLTERFGLEVKEYPTTRMTPGQLAESPERRAADLMAAFEDDSVDGIFATIGGDDSTLLLRHLDVDLIRAHPKVFLGFSDTAAPLLFCHRLGMVTFNGPSIMAGFAELERFPEAERHVRAMLFDASPTFEYEPFPQWVDSYGDWTDGRLGEVRSHDGWHWLNGASKRRGRLVGGCIEVLELLKGSRFWPEGAFWDDRLLFLETSEAVPSVEQVRCMLFNYGVQGVFDRIAGLLVGRAWGYSDEQKAELDEMIVQTVVGQFGAADVVVVSNLDFGHTQPQWVLPLGVMAEIDPAGRTFRLVESATLSGA